MNMQQDENAIPEKIADFVLIDKAVACSSCGITIARVNRIQLIGIAIPGINQSIIRIDYNITSRKSKISNFVSDCGKNINFK